MQDGELKVIRFNDFDNIIFKKREIILSRRYILQLSLNRSAVTKSRSAIEFSKI